MTITKRDHVWKAALECLSQVVERKEDSASRKYKSGWFKLEDVKRRIEGDVADRTIRDCLMAMVELDILYVRRSRPNSYRAPDDIRDSDVGKLDLSELFSRL